MDTRPKGKRIWTVGMCSAPEDKFYLPGSTADQPPDERTLAADKIVMSTATAITPAAELIMAPGTVPLSKALGIVSAD